MSKKPTYATRIYDILKSRNNEMTIETIMSELEICDSKMCYIIDGLKSNIKNGLVEKLENPFESRLWLGHKYRARR